MHQLGRTYEGLILLDNDGTPISVEAARIVQRERPEVRIGERARRALDGYLRELGLTPAQRSRIAMPKLPWKDSLLDHA